MPAPFARTGFVDPHPECDCSAQDAHRAIAPVPMPPLSLPRVEVGVVVGHPDPTAPRLGANCLLQLFRERLAVLAAEAIHDARVIGTTGNVVGNSFEGFVVLFADIVPQVGPVEGGYVPVLAPHPQDADGIVDDFRIGRGG